MRYPRFDVGDLVVFTSSHIQAGCVDEVLEVTFYKGKWLCKTSKYPWAAEEHLRPYDPPTTWDKCEWQPEEYGRQIESED